LSVVLINPFEVPPGNDDQFLMGWERVAEYMREQPGFISSRLHRALSTDARFRFINVAEWQSPQDFQAAVANEQFQRMASGTPPNYPALFEEIRSI
jgi:heme oxygenase (mycobilin-producing)